MKIYYYNTVSIKNLKEKWKNGFCPGHILYGVTEFDKYGIDYIYHEYDVSMSRFLLMFYNAYKIGFCNQKYDAVYGVTFRGLEILIFLRAIGLFRKPIVLWHHTAIVIPKNRLRKFLSKIFYKGIDKMFFFSEELLSRSLKTKKVKIDNAFVVPWGADLFYYNNIIANRNIEKYFISTGIEHRDFCTLINGFNKSEYQSEFHLYVKNWQKIYLSDTLSNISLSPNIRIQFGDWTLHDCALLVNNAYVVVICCLDYPYTVGLTTLVEALALGKAIITTDNPTFPIDVEKEEIGLKVAYGDVEGWVNAINYLTNNPDVVKEMGIKARRLAEKKYNLNICSKKIAEELLSMVNN